MAKGGPELNRLGYSYKAQKQRQLMRPSQDFYSQFTSCQQAWILQVQKV